MKYTKSLLVAAMLLNTTMASAAFVVTNSMLPFPNDDLGATGFVIGDFPSFTLVGSNNSRLAVTGIRPEAGWLTTYTDTFASDATVNFDYTISTNDDGGFGFDRAGYLVNNTFIQLSPDYSDFLPEPVSGSVMISVLAGERFGFYTRSNDDTSGAIFLRVDAELSPSAVPVPAALPLMASALGVFGIARRRNNSKSA